MNRKLQCVMLSCTAILLSGCSAEWKVRSDESATESTFYIQTITPETETVSPVFSHKETEPVPETETYTETESSLYDMLYTEISQFHPVIQIDRKIDTEEISLLMRKLEWQHPEIFWINGYSMKYNDVSAEITLKVLNEYSPDTLRQMADDLDRAAEEILRTVPPYATDEEKALQIHDYLVTHTEYDQSAVSQGKGLWSTAYGCLIGGSAVCQGYSQAFQLLLNRMGVECGICSGNAGGEPHAWNYIRLDQQYYWIDVTWDDPVSDNAPSDWIHHGYFLIDDTMLSRSRTIDDNGQFVPVCSSLDKNYFVRNGNYLTAYHFSEIDSRLTEHIDEGKIEVIFADSESYQKALADLFDHEAVWNAQIFQKSGGTINYQTDEDMYILRLIFEIHS